MGWMMIIWSVVSAGLIVWLIAAEDDVHDVEGHDDDPGRCGCCRHDNVAHEQTDSRPECSQCPCPGFRPSG